MPTLRRPAGRSALLVLLLALVLPQAPLGAQGQIAQQPAAQPPIRTAVQALVTYVADGDTIYVQLPQEPGRQRPVRLQGIDAPEICQEGGPQARAALQDRVLGQTVDLQTAGQDDYGRDLARVYWHGQDLGRLLVQQGLAWSYRIGPQAAPYAAEQRQAREQGRGLFAQAGPEPPWRFRRRHGSCRANP